MNSIDTFARFMRPVLAARTTRLLVDFLLDVLLLGFALRACDRMHRGVDSDIPFIAGFVSSIF